MKIPSGTKPNCTLRAPWAKPAGRMMPVPAHRGGRAGFTFTLSIVLLAITLMAVASFAQEWRKSQQVSFTEILPSESMRLQERVAAGVGQMVQADGSVKSGNASTTLSVSSSQPFKREGESLAQISDYSESLPSNLRNLGYEAVLDANKISGSSSAVIVTSDNGSLVHSNDGAYDVTSFYQPNGFVPSAIYATISCNKQATSVGDISSVGGSGSGGGQYYAINYTEPSGRSYFRNYYASPGSNTTLSITYPDNTLLYFDSRFSPSGQNRTSIHYTKSSSGALILPFSQNSTGAVRDYSRFSENVTLADGGNAPTWKSGCSRGGCYQFDGAGDYMYVPGGVRFTDSEIPMPLGAEKITDPWFETFGGEAAPDDGVGDEWYYWHAEGDGASDIFDATQDASTAQSYYSVRAIAAPESAGTASIYQEVEGISPSTPYVLSFWSKSAGGSAGRYRLEIQADPVNGVERQCLESDGTWAVACNAYFSSAPSTAAYSRTTREFMMPPGASPASLYSVPLTLIVRLYPPSPSGEVDYDSVSLKQSAGMNGGFESYYSEGESILPSN